MTNRSLDGFRLKQRLCQRARPEIRYHTVQPAAVNRLSQIRVLALRKIVCIYDNQWKAQIGHGRQLTARCHEVEYFRGPSVLSTFNAPAVDCSQNIHSGTYRQNGGCFGSTVEFEDILLTVLVNEVEYETLWRRKW